MTRSKPQVVVCTYRVKPGKEPQFRKLLRRHWPTLNRLGFVAGSPRLVLRGADPRNARDLIEIFAWKPGAFETARKSPAVLSIWEPMEQMCEARDGRPAMEFPHYEMMMKP